MQGEEDRNGLGKGEKLFWTPSPSSSASSSVVTKDAATAIAAAVSTLGSVSTEEYTSALLRMNRYPRLL